jgi:hypothetical protein
MNDLDQLRVERCAPSWRRARLLQALDLADQFVDVVAGARVHVHGVVGQRPHVVRYAHSYMRASSDAWIRSSRARRMILSSTSVMFCTYVTAKPRVRARRGEEVELGVGVGVAEVREVVDRRPADEQPDPA